jgi:hypothetical protein
MAKYRESKYLSHSDSSIFTRTFDPGESAPYGGIYRCTGCNREIGIAQYHMLPTQNNHQHVIRALPIRWQPEVLHGNE